MAIEANKFRLGNMQIRSASALWQEAPNFECPEHYMFSRPIPQPASILGPGKYQRNSVFPSRPVLTQPSVEIKHELQFPCPNLESLKLYGRGRDDNSEVGAPSDENSSTVLHK